MPLTPSAPAVASTVTTPAVPLNVANEGVLNAPLAAPSDVVQSLLAVFQTPEPPLTAPLACVPAVLPSQ
ncbi:hypothetical protein G6F65_022379 [Rhizopus arrhizus]|nr:hypothetical protein G6F65_022379 [Rhizopus arrhizus]